MLFPPIIDSTMLSAYTSCPQKFFREYVEHWKAGGESIDLFAGGCFASGQEAARKAYFIEHKSAREALKAGHDAILTVWGDFEAPEGHKKSLHRVIGAFDYYWNAYPFEDEKAIPVEVEFSFSIPLPIKNPTTGDPILYCGRMDAIVDFCHGLYGLDDKTCSALGASWVYKWEHRAQFTGYCWAAREYGKKLAGFLVNGVAFYSEAGELKSGKKSTKQEYGVERCITYREPWEIDRWYTQLLRKINNMIADFIEYERTKDHNAFLLDLDEACNAYGGCKFSQACKSKNPMDIIPLTFVQRVWNPLNHSELSPQEWEQMWIGEKK